MKTHNYLLSTIFVLALSTVFGAANPTMNMMPAMSSSSSCDTTVYLDMDVCAGTVLTIGGQPVYYTGIYTDSLTNQNGCDSTVVYDITYRPQYFYFATDSICPGDSMFLDGQWRYSPGVYYDTLTSMYGCDSIRGVNLIYKSETVIAQTISKCPGESVEVFGNMVTTPGFYYDTVYSQWACDSFFVVEVIDHGVTPVDAQISSNSVCDGDSVVLSASTNGTLIWNTGETGNFSTVPTSATTFTVTATDVNGCVSQDSVNVDVLTVPTLNLNPVTPVCVGTAAVLNASSNGNVTWNVPGVNPIMVYPTQATDYIATSTASNGCTVTDTLTVDVLSKPWLNVNVGDDNLCIGESTNMDVTASGVVVWNTGDTGNIVVTPSMTTTFQAYVLNNDGCMDSTDVDIYVHNTPQLFAGYDYTLCEGQAVTLLAKGNGNITWNQGLPNNSVITPSNSDQFVAHIVDAHGCTNSDTLHVAVNNLPNVHIDDFTQGVIMSNSQPVSVPNAYPSGGDYYGNGVVGYTFDPQVAGVGTHQVYYAYKDQRGCESKDSTSVEVALYNGLEENEFTGSVTMYPNPATTTLNVNLDLGALEYVNYKVISLTGATVTEGQFNDLMVNELDISNLSPGMYMIQLSHEQKVSLLQFVKK